MAKIAKPQHGWGKKGQDDVDPQGKQRTEVCRAMQRVEVCSTVEARLREVNKGTHSHKRDKQNYRGEQNAAVMCVHQGEGHVKGFTAMQGTGL